MALVAATVWEIRNTGNAENGGGFNDRIPGTSVDYSQQNASQLSRVDLACAAGSINITSVAGGFTQAMVGNVMRIHAGTNFTVGFYEIVQWNSANSINVDRVPVTANGTVGHGEVGGAQINLDLIDTVVVPGNIVWIKAGTYAAHPTISFTLIPTKYLPLRLIGYDAARGDNPTGNNRPLVQFGANSITVQNVVFMRNIRSEYSGTINLVYAGGNDFALTIVNCKFTNTKATAGIVPIIDCASRGPVNVIDTEISGTVGATSRGISTDTEITMLNCYLHDLTVGIYQPHPAALTPTSAILFSIFANIGTNAIHHIDPDRADVSAFNNTFASCGTDGYFEPVQTDIRYPLFMNNSFTDCVVAGIDADGMVKYNNNFFSDGVPIITTHDPLRLSDGSIFVNPQFVTPGSVYALQRTSGLIDRAFSMRLGV